MIGAIMAAVKSLLAEPEDALRKDRFAQLTNAVKELGKPTDRTERKALLAQISGAIKFFDDDEPLPKPPVPIEHLARAAWLSACKAEVEKDLAEQRKRLERALVEIDGKAQRAQAALEAEVEARHVALSSQLAIDLNEKLDLAISLWHCAPERKNVAAVASLIREFDARARVELGRELSVWCLLQSMALALISDEGKHLEASLLATLPGGERASTGAVEAAGLVLKHSLASLTPVVEASLLRFESSVLESARPSGAASQEQKQRFEIARTHVCPTLRAHALSAYDRACGERHAAVAALEHASANRDAAAFKKGQPVPDDEEDDAEDSAA